MQGVPRDRTVLMKYKTRRAKDEVDFVLFIFVFRTLYFQDIACKIQTEIVKPVQLKGGENKNYIQQLQKLHFLFPSIKKRKNGFITPSRNIVDEGEFIIFISLHSNFSSLLLVDLEV